MIEIAGPEHTGNEKTKYLMLVSDILVESEDTDRAAREEAVAIFNHVHSALDDPRLRSMLTPHSSHGGSFVVRGMGLPDDLLLLLAPEDTTPSLGGVKTKDGKRRKIISLPVLIAPGDLTHIATRFRGQMLNFVHEYQHYTISSRSGGRSAYSAQAAASGDLTAYYNNPDETNAYYQEAAHKMEARIAMLLQNSRHEKIANLLDDIMALDDRGMLKYFYADFVEKEYLKHASEKARRAMSKRAIRFFRETIRPMISRTSS
jgi:hypothetical protein